MCNAGAIGVIGMVVVNVLVARVDFVLAIGMCLGDFSIGLCALFVDSKLVQFNVVSFDVVKYGVFLLVVDVDVGFEVLGCALKGWKVLVVWIGDVVCLKRVWNCKVE